MRMKAKVAASVLLAAGLLAGCSPQAGVAATVNGEEITVAEVDEGMSLSPFYAEPPAPANVVASLIQARAVIDAAKAEGMGVSATEASAFLDSLGAQELEVDGEYPEAVLDLVRMNLITQSLQTAPQGQGVVDAVNDYMMNADIEFNPRYGTWDIAQGGLTQALPEWIELEG